MNLADNVDNFLGSDFYRRIANHANILTEDVQKYILVTSDFAKGMQADINNYVTSDRINNASFRQKRDPIKKNVLRRQNPLEIVFGDIWTFDSENPIIGSLLKELDGGKKLTAGDLVKRASGPLGVDFGIRNRLNKLRERKNNRTPASPPPPTSFLPPPLPPPPHFNLPSPPPGPPLGAPSPPSQIFPSSTATSTVFKFSFSNTTYTPIKKFAWIANTDTY